jgi:SGNH hydrolase-like domain, acetyltransferase AlgX
MKKFIVKGSFFILPLLVLHVFTFYFYSTKKGDLLRVGYIIDLYPSYRDIFNGEIKNTIMYSKVSEFPKKRKFKVLTIGDSFTDQLGYGYNNHLVKNNNTDVLYFDRFLSGNQIETLFNLLKGDFFDQYKIEFIVLQNVERNFVYNSQHLDTTKILTYSKIVEIAKEKRQKEDYSYQFPSNRVFKFPYYFLQYHLKKDYLFNNQVYRTQTTKQLFSINNKQLFFYKGEVNSTKRNNDQNNVRRLNDMLNNLNSLLKKKEISLVVLPSPDKYDMYYEYILNKTNFPKPYFFEILDTMTKEYLFINSKKILDSAVATKKDIYFYDDTHWSPWACQLIAKKISEEIENSKNIKQ